jgi:hypothetical protein
MIHENGFYWVQITAGVWEVVEWYEDCWVVNDHWTPKDEDLHVIHDERIKEPSYKEPWTSFVQDQMNMVFEVIDPNIKVQQIAINRIIARDYAVKLDVTQPYLCQQFELPEEGSLSALCGEILE